MNKTAGRRPLNDAFKHSQPLPQLPGSESSSENKPQSAQASKPLTDNAKQLRHFERPWASIRRSFICALEFDAAFGLLVAVCLVAPTSHEGGLLFPGSRAGMSIRPEAPPTTAARANLWHRSHHPFPTHHLPASPADHSINIQDPGRARTTDKAPSRVQLGALLFSKKFPAKRSTSS